MEQPVPRPHPIRAEDFARGFSENVPGQQKPSPGPPSRGPVTPEERCSVLPGAWFDFGQLTPVDVGKLDNNDDAGVYPVGSPHPAKPAVTKQPDANSPWGPPDAWSKDKAR